MVDIDALKRKFSKYPGILRAIDYFALHRDRDEDLLKALESFVESEPGQTERLDDTIGSFADNADRIIGDLINEECQKSTF